MAWAFDHFVHKWHVDVLYKECGWAEHFLRDEFAMLRGMTHAHCLGMLEGAPTISQIEAAIKEIELSGARGGGGGVRQDLSLGGGTPWAHSVASRARPS